jgi:hypothetical protein
MARNFFVKILSATPGSGPFSIYYNAVGIYATRVSTGLAASNVTLTDLTTGKGVEVTVDDNYNSMIIVDEEGVCDDTPPPVVPKPPANAVGCIGDVSLMAFNGGSYLPGALNTGRISIALNNAVDLSGKISCTTCGVCNEYIIMADSFYMDKTDLPNSRVMCLCTESKNTATLTSYLSLIATKKNAGPFATLADAMDWARSEGLFIINQNYPQITTQNQVLLLDAGLPSSYPMQGTSWYNMAANNNTGTLNGGITFSDTDIMDQYGNLHFNATTGYVSFASTTNIPVGSSDYTISVWFSPDLQVNGGLIGWGNYSVNNQSNSIKITTTGIVNSWGTNTLSATTNITTQLWHNVVATFDGTTRKLYLDGQLLDSDTPVGLNVSSSSNLEIGKVDTSYYDGKISFVQIFSSALSNTDIVNSYNNFVTRYDGSCTQICVTPVFCNTPTPTPTSDPTPTQTSTQTPTPNPTPTPTPIYSVFFADEYDCNTCTVSQNNVVVQLPIASTPNYSNFYAASTPSGFVYKLTSTTTGTGILLNSASQSSCVNACSL